MKKYKKLSDIKRLNEVSRDSRLKWFISTKAKFPNRFNCDNEFEVKYLILMKNQSFLIFNKKRGIVCIFLDII